MKGQMIKPFHRIVTVFLAVVCLGNIIAARAAPKGQIDLSTQKKASEGQEAPSGAAASDPTSTVNFQDVRYRYFDLGRGRESHSFETEGSYVFNPRFKVTNKLIGVNTDKGGSYETDFQVLTLKAIHLTPMKPFGINAKFAVGGEWL